MNNAKLGQHLRLVSGCMIVTAVVLISGSGAFAVPGVTAFWDFDGPTPPTDKTGNGHDLILPGGSNNPTIGNAVASGNGWSPAGLYGVSATFDGGDYLAIPNSAYSGGDFTFFVAQHTAGATGFDTLLASSRFRYQNVNDTLSGAINAPGGSFGGSTPISANDWHFIALRYDSTTQTLESFAATNTGTLGAPLLSGIAAAPGLGNASNFRLGGDGTSGIGGFDGWAGQLDFAGFHDGKLTNAQLQSALTEFVAVAPV